MRRRERFSGIPTRPTIERRRSQRSIVLRHLEADDVAPLMAASPLFDHPLDRVAVSRYLAHPDHHVWLAYDGSRPVGFLRGTELLQVETRNRQFLLYEIAVDREHRRKGVARGLVRAMLRFLGTRGHVEAFVFTSPHNRAAVALYRSTGGVTETDADRMFVYRVRATRKRQPSSRRVRSASPRPRRA